MPAQTAGLQGNLQQHRAVVMVVLMVCTVTAALLIIGQRPAVFGASPSSTFKRGGGPLLRRRLPELPGAAGAPLSDHIQGLIRSAAVTRNFVWPAGQDELLDAAVVITWDDNNYASNERAIELARDVMPETTVPMMFNANPGCDDCNATQMRALLVPGSGNEITSHTWSHEDLNMNNDSVMVASLVRSFRQLSAEVGANNTVSALVYPYGQIPNPEHHPVGWATMMSLYTCARSVTEGVNIRQGFDRYRINPIDTNKDVSAPLAAALNQSGLIVLYGHGIQGHGGWGATPEAVLNQTLRTL